MSNQQRCSGTFLALLRPPQCHRHIDPLSSVFDSPLDRYRQLVALLVSIHCREEIPDAFYGLAVDGDDEIAEHDLAGFVAACWLQAGFLCRTAVAYRFYQDAFEAVLVYLLVGEEFHTEDRAGHFAAEDKLSDDAVDFVHRNGEADAGGAAGGAVDGGVHADEPAGAVQQRAAGIAGVDRGVGLDDVLDRHLGDRLDLPAQGADDAGGQGLVEAERVADGVDVLADLQVVGGADLDRMQSLPSGASILRTATSLSG